MAIHPLVYPRCIKVAPLEYEWDGYANVILFSTGDDEDTVQEWYQKRELTLDGSLDDQYDFYTDDTRKKKVAEVLFACSESFEDLSSYLGSETLDSMIAAKPATIGVVFIVKDE